MPVYTLMVPPARESDKREAIDTRPLSRERASLLSTGGELVEWERGGGEASGGCVRDAVGRDRTA
jgi:hypothetical protein